MELGVYILGSSAAVATKQRSLPCIAVVYRGSVYLFDPGEGCQRGLQEAGLSPLRIKLIAVTHLHGDHLFGLPGLIQTMSLNNRDKSLIIAGPRGLCEFIDAAEKATLHYSRFDIKCVRVHDGFKLEFSPGIIIKAFSVKHTIEAYGYTFQEPQRPGKIDVAKALALGIKPGPLLAKLRRGEKVVVGGRLVRPDDVVSPPMPGARIVYTGDTAPTERVIEEAKKATVLIHDATFTEDMREEAHSQGHSTALDAAHAARKAEASLLVLTHISARYNSVAGHVAEARRIHPYVVAAEDLLKIPVRL